MQEPSLEQIFGSYMAWKMDEKAPTLCRVRWKNVSIFIKKDLLMTVYGRDGARDSKCLL